MSNTYNHKNIDFSFISQCSEDNYYINSIPRIYKKLFNLYEGTEEYIPEDYHFLVLAFEKLYKGTCKELQYMHPDKIKVSQTAYTNGHRFSQFAAIIDDYIQISPTREGYNRVIDSLHSIELLFNDTRYNIEKNINEFRNDFRKFESALCRFSKGLENEQNKLYVKSEIEDELKDW